MDFVEKVNQNTNLNWSISLVIIFTMLSHKARVLKLNIYITILGSLWTFTGGVKVWRVAYPLSLLIASKILLLK